MVFNASFIQLPHMSEEHVSHMIEKARKELIHALFEQVRDGQWYAIRFDEKTFSMGEELEDGMIFPNHGERKTIYSLQLKECQTQRVKIPTLEEMAFIPQTSFWKRLKNCFRYMREGGTR